jgi:hypothetical protein
MKVPKLRRAATTAKSIHMAGISSVPKIQRSQYLELYSLGREKTRLAKEMLVLDTRRETIHRHLEGIHKRILTLQQEMIREHQAEMGAKTPNQPIKMVDINY